MDEQEIHRRTADNRRLVADFVDGLGEAQLEARSLCSAWTVREVVAHLAMPMLVGFRRLAMEIVRQRGSVNRASEAIAADLARRPVGDLTGVLRRKAEMRMPAPGVGPMGQLCDTAVHLRDMARPLGLGADVPVETWRRVLDWLPTKQAALGVVAKGRLDGLRLEVSDPAAPDLPDWSWGAGAEIRGSSEAVAMAVAGRAAALADLTGGGVELLRERLTGR